MVVNNGQMLPNWILKKKTFSPWSQLFSHGCDWHFDWLSWKHGQASDGEVVHSSHHQLLTSKVQTFAFLIFVLNLNSVLFFT